MNGGSTSPVVNWPRFAALAAVAVVVALVLGWQSAEVAVPPAQKPPRSAWDLPVHPEADTAKELALLTQRKPWTGELGAAGLAAAATKNTAAEWRLAGVVERADGNFALIAIGKSGEAKYEYRTIGEKLPDGSTLVELSSDTATTRTGDVEGVQSIYKLFAGPAPAPKPPSAGASGSAPPASGPSASPNRRTESQPQSPLPAHPERHLRRADARQSRR